MDQTNKLDDLPRDLEAEKAVLGAMLVSAEAIADVAQILKPKHFSWGANKIILEQIYALNVKNIAAEPLSLIDTLRKQNLIENVGGEVYITELLDNVSTTSNVLYWANIVHEKYIQRQLIISGFRIAQLGHLDGAGDADEALNLAQHELFALANEDQRSEYEQLGLGVMNLLTSLDAMKHNDNVLGVSSGFKDLDEKIHGFANGQMIVIGARPGVGKTAIAVDIARHIGIRNEQEVYFISLEMSNEELYSRILSAESNVKHTKFLKPSSLNQNDWQRLRTAQQRIENSPLYIESPPGITIPELRAKARQMKQQKGIKLLIIDYLGLITALDPSMSRVQIITEFTRSIKILSKELDIPIILLSQLNRESEKRAAFGSQTNSAVDRSEPKMSELRESGSIEQDADVVLLLHRSSLPASDNDTYSNEAKLIVAKNRRGAQGSVFLKFEGDFVRFLPTFNPNSSHPPLPMPNDNIPLPSSTI
ncbi:MAG: replicative DNA helicase [Bifidobacteriaceae bacterium]|jgi:replicative DNA helicase|nr:replicative DNA helicase [Bifidobacteriaceae bacterium]